MATRKVSVAARLPKLEKAFGKLTAGLNEAGEAFAALRAQKIIVEIRRLQKDLATIADSIAWEE